MDTKKKTLELVQLALFIAIILIMAFTPFLGYIPLFVTRITILHIPVIIGSIIMGYKNGAILGFIFGLTSLINNTINPTATSFVFSPFYSIGEAHGNLLSLVVCFVPRILVGVVPYFVYKLLSRKDRGSTVALVSSGIVGSLINTILVMGFIYLFFADSYSLANNISSTALYIFIIGIIGTNGIPEAIVSAIVTTAICKVLIKLNFSKK
ncbi:MAG: ECF transporter S component [Tyzzerella sp.]|uniref:ECF transporter S component n=1 Tax=Candidatus Fimicola merdigallinarum TaxID=2840819 RepID=A0A9D9DXI6_9FIRM|nr:ECF transporter S component [Candidatus Fimicola merdigallinarum]